MRIGITCDLKDTTAAVAGPDDWQEEFDSPETVDAIAGVLRAQGHDVRFLGNGRPLLEKLLADPPDLVFNFAEGHGVSRSREARVPAVLEMLNIPYTGSDPLTLAATLDKTTAKTLVAAEGVQVPLGITIAPDQPASAVNLRTLPFPVIVKPAWEGSSKGIRHRCLVQSYPELAEVVEQVRRDYRQPVLVEEYIAGEELTVGIVGNAPPRVIGTLRVVPREPTPHFVYSLEVKRDYLNQVRYETPPQLSEKLLAKVEQAALAAYRALGCRDVARVDFRVRDRVPYFLEVNPLPGLHPVTSDLVILATGMGWSYAQLIDAIVTATRQRLGI